VFDVSIMTEKKMSIQQKNKKKKDKKFTPNIQCV